ncbi:cathepsin D2 [Geranomyces variabilis]|nr:cathepsin D2 [Geranomyces variabilis]KAJ3139057.1 hypothetical protein HDU90_000963 [Geranomyces variabilis]
MKVTAAFGLALAVTSVSAAAIPSNRGHAIPLTKVPKQAPLGKRVPGILHGLAKKFGATVPAALRPNHLDGGSEPISNVQNMEYYGPATIGGQTIQLLYDTGSADLWVPDASVSSLPGKNKYDPKKSKTYKDIGGDFNIQYGSGQAVGKTASETVTVAGITVTKQVFGDVTDEGQNPQASDFDGICGFSFGNIASDKAPTWFENAVTQKAIAKPVFSFFLSSTAEGSEMFLGGSNPSHYTGEPTYVPIDKPGYWQFGLKDITYNGASINPSLNEAIADTGTSLVVGPSADVTAINNKIGAKLDSQQGIYTIACSKRNDKDTVSFPIEGLTISLTANEYILDDGQGGCISTFAPLDGLPVWILGDTVLRKYYSIYDMGDIANNYSGARIGFALVNGASTGGGGSGPATDEPTPTATATDGPAPPSTPTDGPQPTDGPATTDSPRPTDGPEPTDAPNPTDVPTATPEPTTTATDF